MCRQRDSGDDEDMDKASEDEEGQLEEQIERLQEKVESAQSEQKNLFLVIFQVLKEVREDSSVSRVSSELLNYTTIVFNDLYIFLSYYIVSYSYGYELYLLFSQQLRKL